MSGIGRRLNLRARARRSGALVTLFGSSILSLAVADPLIIQPGGPAFGESPEPIEACNDDRDDEPDEPADCGGAPSAQENEGKDTGGNYQADFFGIGEPGRPILI